MDSVLLYASGPVGTGGANRNFFISSDTAIRPERVAWISHMLTDWIGDDGFLRRLNTQIRRHNPVGDAVWCTGTVTGKTIEGDRHLVQCEVLGKNQHGELSIKGTAEVELPAQ